MLGNNADAFFTTPMRTKLVNGGNVGNQSPMPAPRDINQSATGVVTTRLTGDFLPGIGDEPVVPAPSNPQPSTNAGSMLAMAGTPVGIAVIAGVLFFTPLGKNLRRKIGLG